MPSYKFRLIFQVEVIIGTGLKEIAYYTCEEYEENNNIITFVDQYGYRRCFVKQDVISIIPVLQKNDSETGKQMYKKFNYYQCKEEYTESLVSEPDESYGDEYIPSDFEN